jgi:hypothetical protein
MTRTEQRLTDALAARAEAVDANSVRPLPWAVAVREPRGPRPRKWVAPVAAAISIVVVAAAVAFISRHAPRAGHDPITAERTMLKGRLYDVDALSAANAWAVGFTNLRRVIQGDPVSEPLIMHWDGTRWRRVPAPSEPGGGLLESVSGRSPNDLWAAGSWGNTLGSSNRPLILHWNGKGWHLVRFAADAEFGHLYDISARSPDDVWATGDAGAKDHGLILHWNGRTWRQLPVPHNSGQFIFGVTAISANDAWALGSKMGGETIMHWNGASWGLVRPPGSGNGSLQNLTALAADEVWAAGFGADGVGFQVARWDGTAWKMLPDRGLPPFGGGLGGVAVSSPDNLWAVGAFGHFTSNVLLAHWNGVRWSRPAFGRNLPGALDGLSASSANDLWAVGNLNNGDPLRGVRPLILHWNGTSWTKVLS